MSCPVKCNKKIIMFLLLMVFVIPAFVLYVSVIQPKMAAHQTAQINGVILPSPKEIENFKLTDNLGKPFSKKNLQGHWTMMFFGFTNCGMVCPTTLASLNEMYKTLQKELSDNQLPQVLLISVDPERDSVEKMNEYVTTFNPHFTGARGSMSETVALEKTIAYCSCKNASRWKRCKSLYD